MSSGDSLEKAGCRNGNAVRERGGGQQRVERTTPAANSDWSCVFRGLEDGRRVFVELEAAPQGNGSGGGSGGKRVESGKGTLREPSGGEGVGGARSFFSAETPFRGTSFGITPFPGEPKAYVFL